MNPSFSTVTEMPGSRATNQQRSMLYTRYHLAKTHSVDRDVLEVGCGAGMGLGYLAHSARSVIGSDIDERNLRVANESYGGRSNISLRHEDAQQLEHADNSVDTLLLFEAIYYLTDAARFVAEARRVLRPGGTLIICTVNRQWRGFNPSPHSVHYFDAPELRGLLEQHNFNVCMFGAFPDQESSFTQNLIAAIRTLAVRLRLIPRTMRGKQWLKRMFYGRLDTLQREVTQRMALLEPLTGLAPHDDSEQFKVLYAVATVDKQSSERNAA
jgi:ubiquinone/menaquinone biosynthesis C-methylase UbiE